MLSRLKNVGYSAYLINPFTRAVCYSLCVFAPLTTSCPSSGPTCQHVSPSLWDCAANSMESQEAGRVGSSSSSSMPKPSHSNTAGLCHPLAAAHQAPAHPSCGGIISSNHHGALATHETSNLRPLRAEKRKQSSYK